MTGGLDAADNKLSSTEIYRNKAWTVLSSAALPSPSWGLSAGNIDNTIFVFGKKVHLKTMILFVIEAEIHPKILVTFFDLYILGGDPTVGILKFNPRTEKWEDVGSFSRNRYAMQAGFRYFKF